MDLQRLDNIERLIERYLEIVNSDRNLKNREKWGTVQNWNRDMWRGFPKLQNSGAPYTIAPDNSLWSKLLNINLIEYYSDPYSYLETQLRMRIFQFENFQDNTVFTEEVYIWFGAVTELSMFGSELTFYPNKEPWVKGHILDSYEKLDSLSIPDFYKSGFMPKIHQYYQIFSELAKGRLKIMFPEFVRGPFCIASHLRGVQELLMDMLDYPEEVCKLMGFITKAHKQWGKEREKFTGEKQKGVKLYNDEIDGTIISPDAYREFIYPFEKELAEEYGGVNYWHSCGNTTRLIEEIGKLPGLKMFHCGPWTDYGEADRLLAPKGVSLDVCLSPQSDILEADSEKMEQKIRNVMEKCVHAPYAVRADGFMPYQGINELEKIKAWAQVAEAVLRVQ